MTRYIQRNWLPLALGLLSLPATLLVLGCKDFLSVTDPDIIPEANSAAGAIALHDGAVLRLAQAVTGTQGPDALFLFGGLLADEWRSGDTFVQRNNQDRRIWDPANTFNAGPFRNLNRTPYVLPHAAHQRRPDVRFHRLRPDADGGALL